MKRAVLAAIIALFSASVLAANMIARDSVGNSITLMDEPCVSSPWLKDWKTASMIFQGKSYAACWRIQENSVMVIDSGGDVSVIPPNIFKRETGV